MSGKFTSHRIEKLQGECEQWREIGAKDNPSFDNSWVNYNSATDETAAFYKDKFNRVWLKGSIKDGTTGAVPAFTLPSGYRPSLTVSYSSIDGAGTPSARINVQNDGEVQIGAGTNTFISMDGVSWRV